MIFKIKNNPGVSLFVALVFVSALMIVSASLTRQIIAGTQNRARYDHKMQMQYLAQSNEEAARWMIKYKLKAGGTEADIAPATLTKVNDNLQAIALSTVCKADASDYAECARQFAASCVDADPVAAGNQPCFEIKIRGRGTVAQAGAAPNGAAPQNADFGGGTLRFNNKDLYSVPLKGTGDVLGDSADAGARCVNVNDANDPCNWNRLAFGQSVEIPLYYEQVVNGQTQLVGLANNSDFYLRMRTPCKDGAASANSDAIAAVHALHPESPNPSSAEASTALQLPEKIPGTNFPRNCGVASDRVILYPRVGSPDYLSFAKDPVLVQWLIKGTGLEDLVAKEGKIAEKRLEFGERNFNTTNSQLSAGRVNGANRIGDFVIIAKDNQGVKILHQGSAFQLPAYSSGNLSLHPKLKLNAIDYFSLNDNDTKSNAVVPYLEYQLLTSAQVSEYQPKYEVTVRLFGMSFKKSGELTPQNGSANDLVLGNL